MTFKEFNFHPLLYQGIEASGYENATPVQELVIPSILANRDLIASAQTGTGKTAAFLLPLINRYIDHKHEHKVSALIIVPTRELAKQISQHIEGFTYFTELSFIAIYGAMMDKILLPKKSTSDGCGHCRLYPREINRTHEHGLL